MSIEYRDLPETHVDQAVEVLATALIVEPGFKYIVTDETDRLWALRLIMTSMVKAAMRKGRVFAAVKGNDLMGAAVLLSPGNYPVSFWESLRAMRYYLPLRKLGKETANNLRAFDENAKKYFPGDSWYLEAFGVSPKAQGNGVGSGLAKHLIAELGNDTCYLETATPANISFYQRAGFEILNDAAQLAPAPGPTHWTMVHKP